MLSGRGLNEKQVQGIGDKEQGLFVMLVPASHYGAVAEKAGLLRASKGPTEKNSRESPFFLGGGGGVCAGETLFAIQNENHTTKKPSPLACKAASISSGSVDGDRI